MSGVQRFVVAEDSLAPRSVVGDKEYAGCVDVVLAADHARIVAEATAEARAAERRHWEARFRNAEQAHAAALAEEVQTHLDSLDILRAEHAAALAEAYTLMGAAVENVIEAEQPRTITDDDRPDYKWDQEEVDDLRRQGYERGLADARAAVDAVGRWRSFPDDTLLSRAAVLAAIDALIHDGEATP